MEKLHSLKINFHGCKSITSKGLEGLMKSLTSFQKLKKFGLNFGDCEKLSGSDVNEIFVQYFSQARIFSNLKELDLCFSGCSFTTVESKRCLEIIASGLVSPKELWISLPNFSSTDIKEFPKILQNIIRFYSSKISETSSQTTLKTLEY